ncbi:hypothetical protein TWF730_001682 [Orbilia blumenaviensis]|uniref:Uncharacterized protein n=1 Tax=Orbilia blumenaviensis TaxID=1796055 RepID=A0AAV9UIL7_9PEZI
MGKAKKAKGKAKRERKVLERIVDLADETAARVLLQDGSPEPQPAVTSTPGLAVQSSGRVSSGPIAPVVVPPGELMEKLERHEAEFIADGLQTAGNLLHRLTTGHGPGGIELTDKDKDEIILFLNKNSQGMNKARKEAALKLASQIAVVSARMEADLAKIEEGNVVGSSTRSIQSKDAAVPLPLELMTASDIPTTNSPNYGSPPAISSSSPPFSSSSSPPVFSSLLASSSQLPVPPCSTKSFTPTSRSPNTAPPYSPSPSAPTPKVTTSTSGAAYQSKFREILKESFESDPEAYASAQREILIAASTAKASQLDPYDQDFQARLGDLASASRERFKELLVEKSPAYLAGFLDATKFSLKLEGVTVDKTHEPTKMSDMKIPDPDDPVCGSSLGQHPTRRQEFVDEFVSVAEHLGGTLFDTTAINEGKSVHIWMEDGEIRWVIQGPDNSLPELATLKEPFCATHECTGYEKDGHGFCLSCLTEMKWDDLLDFSPALGLPCIRRPRGWKPPFDEDTDTTSEAGEATTNLEGPSISLSETSNPNIEEREQTGSIEAPVQQQATKREDKNRKRNGIPDVVFYETTPDAASSQTVTKVKPTDSYLTQSSKSNERSNTSSTSPPKPSRNSPSTDSSDFDSPDEGPIVLEIYEKYKKILPTAIPDGARFKFSSGTQPEREIPGSEMRDILAREVHGDTDPEFTTAILRTLMADANIDVSALPKLKKGTTFEICRSSTATSQKSTEPKALSQSEAPVTEAKAETKVEDDVKPEVKTGSNIGSKTEVKDKPKTEKRPGKKPVKKTKSKIKGKAPISKRKGMPALEEYNTLRAQRLELVLGIGRFVIESIRSGKRPYFDVSLDGRIEFGHSDFVYPVRMLRSSQSDSEEGAPILPAGIDVDHAEVRMVTAPIVRITDRETPDIGDGMNNVSRDFKYPNLIAMQEMFRHVKVVDHDGKVDIKGKGKARRVNKDDGNSIPKGTVFGLKQSIKQAKTKAEVGEAVFLGSQKYKILPSGGPGGRKIFGNMRSLTTTFTRAMDMCEEVQTWVKTQKRNIALRDVLGDDPLWPVNPNVPRKPIGGDEDKPATKPAPTKPVPVKPGRAVASQEADDVASEEEGWGFEAHINKMNECLQGIEANDRKVRAIIEETLRDHPWPPRDEL